MPELPEVETIVRDAQRLLTGKKIARMEVFFKPIVHTPLKPFIKTLNGATIKGASRRAKFILLELDRPFILMVHLKMTGQLLVSDKKEKDKHTHVIFHLS